MHKLSIAIIFTCLTISYQSSLLVKSNGRIRRQADYPDYPQVSTKINEGVAVSSFLLNATVRSRYLHAVVNSVMRNEEDSANEIVFQVQLPVDAFISNFSMLVKNEWIVGTVMTKEDARKVYDNAKSLNQSAGILSGWE